MYLVVAVVYKSVYSVFSSLSVEVLKIGKYEDFFVIITTRCCTWQQIQSWIQEIQESFEIQIPVRLPKPAWFNTCFDFFAVDGEQNPS